jgi:hypothetical protein
LWTAEPTHFARSYSHPAHLDLLNGVSVPHESVALMERKGRPGRLMEQQNLLGGVDLVVVAPRPDAGRGQQVESRWKVGFAAALALVVEHGKKAQERVGVPSRTRCPRCHSLGDTVRDFGVRFVRGRRIPQSWCRTCRSTQAGGRGPQQRELLSNTAA